MYYFYLKSFISLSPSFSSCIWNIQNIIKLKLNYVENFNQFDNNVKLVKLATQEQNK